MAIIGAVNVLQLADVSSGWNAMNGHKRVPQSLSIRGSGRLSFISHMALCAGDRLRPYKIVAPIGKGGMYAIGALAYE